MMRARTSGFTLIEIVVTILITAIIMGIIGLIVQSTVDRKILVQSEARARRLGPTIMSTISQDLRNAWATGDVEGVEIDGVWFRGEHNGGDDDAQDELRFVTSVDSYMRYEGVSSDITEVGYFVVENDTRDSDDPLSGLYSLYRREDFSVDKRPDEGGLGIKLHDRVVSFRVWYYELPRDAVESDGYVDIEALEDVVSRDSPDVLDEWDSREMGGLPYAVRVELILDATPIDAYTRNRKKRYAVYETVVRFPDYPPLDEESQLFAIEPLEFPDPEGEEGEENEEEEGGNNENNQNPPGEN